MSDSDSEMAGVCRAIVKQSLQWYELPRTENAIRLLCMIAAHESGGFYYIKQVNHDLPKIAEYMAFNPVYGAAIARVYLLRIPEPLPEPSDIDGLAKYAKDHWNTYLGAAKWEDYRNAWLQHYS